MNQLLGWLLALLYSLSGAAMKENADFWHSTFAAESGALAKVPNFANNRLAAEHRDQRLLKFLNAAGISAQGF